MAYGRRSRRYRRRNNRNRRALSTTRVLTQTGARAQSKQILALRKRVNYIARRDKPEFKQYTWLLNDYLFTNEFNNRGYQFQWLPTVVQGVSDFQQIGNKIRLSSVRIMGQFSYNNNASSGSDTVDPAGGYVRIIVLRNKQSNGYNTEITPDGILTYGTTSGSSSNYQMQVASPFRDGITTMYDIALDYKFPLTQFRSHKMINLNVPLRKGGRTVTTMISNNGTLQSPNHWFWIGVVTSGLTWHSTGPQENISGNLGVKVVWTDA